MLSGTSLEKQVGGRAIFACMLSLAFLLLIAPLSVQAVSNSGITYHGRILKPDGSSLEGHSVQFKIQLRTAGSEGCVMFEEQQTLNMQGTGGVFALTINDGSGQRTDSSGYTIDQVFQNRGSFSFPTSTCQTGSGGTTAWAPNGSDGRKMQVYFRDESMTGWEPLPIADVNFAPFAIEAKQVGGFKAGSLLRVEDPVTGPQAAAPFTPANFVELQALIAGTSNQYSKSTPNGIFLPTRATAPSSTATGQIWFDTSSNQLKFFDGTGTQTVAASGSSGTVTSVTAGAGLSGGSITTAGTIALATSGVAAGTYQSVAVDTYGRVTSGGALTEAQIPTLSTAGKVSGSAISSGTIGGSTAVNTSGNITTTGNVTAASLTSSSVGSNDVRVYKTGNGFYISIKASATLGGNYTLTLPDTAGTVGQVLTTDGSGVLSWTNPAAGSITALTGDVTASGSGSVAATVANVGGSTAAAVHAAELAVAAATDVNTVSTIVKRDGSGNFSAGALSGSSFILRDTGSKTAILQAPTSITTSYVLKLPLALGTAGQVLSTDAAGNLSWLSPNAGSLTSVTAGTGLTGGVITSSGTIAVNVGTGANQIVQLDGSSKLPAVDGSALTGLNASNLASGTVSAARLPALTGDVTTVAGSAATTLANSAVTTAKINDAAVTTPKLFANPGVNYLVATDASTGAALAPFSCTITGQTLSWNIGTGWGCATPTSGTVTNVGLSMPAIFSVSPSTVTSAGTFAATLVNQNANLVFAGPASGGAAAPTFRALAAADIPSGIATQWVSGAGGAVYYNGGNVGIGTTNPGVSLDLGSKTDAVSLPKGTTAQQPASAVAGMFRFNTQTTALEFYNGSAWTQVGTSTATGTVTSVVAGSGLTGGTITASGTIAVDTGAGPNQIVQLDGSSKLPAVDGSALTALNAGALASGTLPVGRLPAFTGGDVTSSAGSATLTLANTVTAGTYSKVIVDAKGRVTGSTALVAADIPSLDWAKITTGTPTTVAGYGITDAVTNAGSAKSLASGTFASKPAFGTAGRIYLATDTQQLLFDTGAAWSVIASSSGSGGTITALTGDVTAGGTGSVAATVASVGGSTAAAVHAADLAVAAATNTNTVSTIVKRDATGNFSAGAISGGNFILRDSISNTATLQAPTNITTSYALKLPLALGTAGQVLSTDAAGNLSWLSPNAGSVTSVATGVGLTGGPITGSGTIAVNVGTGANQIVQLDASSKLPAVDGSALTGLNASSLASGTLPAARMPALTGDVTTTVGTVATTIANNAVTTAKINDAAVTTPKLFTNPGLNYLVATDASTGASLAPFSCTITGQTLSWNIGTGWGCATPTSGTMTNVGLSLPAIFSVSPSTVTSAGTFAATLVNQNANLVFAGPASGGAAAPTFRALVAADIPSGIATQWVSGAGGVVYYNGGNVGIGTTNPGVSLDLGSKTDAVSLPKGTTAQQPASAVAGMFRFNTQTTALEFYNGSAWTQVGTSTATGTVTSVVAGSGLTGGTITSSGTIGVNVGTGANQIVQLDALSKLPAVDGSALTGLSASAITSGTIAASQLPGSATAWTISGSDIYYSTGKVGIGTTSPQAGLDIASTGTQASAIIVPRDTTANRPTGVNGMIRYNTDTTAFEGYANNTWAALGGSATFPLLGPNGTVSNPTYSFTNSTNTGLYESGNAINFAAGGVNTASVTNSKLQVNGFIQESTSDASVYAPSSGILNFPTSTSGALIANSSSTTGTGSLIQFWNGGGSQVGYFGTIRSAAGSPAMVFGQSSGASSYAERMRIDSSGNVGIGTTNPQATLDVTGTLRVTTICDSTGANCKTVSGGWGGSGSVTSITAGTGLTGGAITTAGTIAVDVGTGANQIVQLDASSKLPAVDGSALTSLNAGAIASGTLPAARMPALTGDVTTTVGTVSTTIANNAVTTAKINNTAVTTPKLFTNPGVNYLVATDASTGAALAPFSCTITGQTLSWNVATGWGCATPTSGTVTNVGLSMPSIFSVSPSTVTSAGTFAATLVNQNANLVFAGPSSGGAAAPTFRALASADIPAGVATQWTTGAGSIVYYNSGSVGIGTTSPTERLTVNSSGLTASTEFLMSSFREASTTKGVAISYWTNSAGTAVQEARVRSVGSIPLALGTTNFTDAISILDTNGNVGIGTTSPSEVLTVQKDQDAVTKILVKNSTNGASAAANFRAYNNNSDYISYGMLSSTNTGFGAQVAGNAYMYTQGAGGLAIMADNASGAIRFATGGNTEKMRLDNSGNVGIGTTSPDSKLVVSGGQMYSAQNIVTYAGAVTVDFSTGNVQNLTLGGNTTITVSNYKAGAIYTVLLKQDATGGRTVTWPATAKWPGGVAPVLSSTVNAVDIFTFVSDGTNVYNIGFASDVK